MDDQLFLFVSANIYVDIKLVSEISIKQKKRPYSATAMAESMCGCVSECVCVCDALAPSCLRLAPRRSLHTTLFLTHCLREEAGDAWASEVQHNEEYTHTYTVTKLHTCAVTPRCTHKLLSSANRH